jgi:hypothetical protein
MTDPSSPDQIGPVTKIFTDVLLTGRLVDLTRYLIKCSEEDKQGEGINDRDLYARHHDFGCNNPHDMTPYLVAIMRLGPLTVSGKSFDKFTGYRGNNKFMFTGIIRYDRSK